MIRSLLALIITAAMVPLYAQTPIDNDDLYDLSLEELMNMTIVSASRSEESAFEAPLSSYAISSTEIFNSGATSIPDALRLCPGLFVKEMANGVYDVSIRGLDNLPSHQFLNTNKLILVMINNRPVFDYLNGGTFWQNLPVDIVDLDRIEVVLGPSAPLYGPNAVTGVINLITKNANNEGLSAVANVQGGTPDTYIGQAWVGYSASEKFDISGSFNYTNRGRGTVDYYDFGRRAYITEFDDNTNPVFQDPEFQSNYYPNPELALEKVSANAGVSYRPASGIVLDLSGGFIKNEALYGSSVVATNSVMSNRSVYGMLKGEAKGFSFMGSVMNGKQGLLGDISSYNYDYNNFDGYVDYNIKVTNSFSLRPAVSFQSSTIDDESYTVEKGQVGVFNNKATMHNYAGSLKADYKVGKFRLIGALRADKFKYPDDLYISYQGMVNYKVNEKNHLRAVVAQSNSGSFIADTYLNIISVSPANESSPLATRINRLGNKDRNLVQNRLYELGYRSKLFPNLQMDLAIFHQTVDGFVGLVTQAPEVILTEGVVNVDLLTSDLDIKAVQRGLTLAFNWLTMKNALSVKPFVTLQKTEWQNYSPYFSSPEANPEYSTATQKDVDSQATPDIYGGVYANYMLSRKWNLNLSGYYMSAYEIFTFTTQVADDTPPYDELPESYIDQKLIVNAKVAYSITPNINIFVSARNAFNSDGREFFATDKIGAMYLGGLHFNW